MARKKGLLLISRVRCLLESPYSDNPLEWNNSRHLL